MRLIQGGALLALIETVSSIPVAFDNLTVMNPIVSSSNQKWAAITDFSSCNQINNSKVMSKIIEHNILGNLVYLMTAFTNDLSFDELINIFANNSKLVNALCSLAKYSESSSTPLASAEISVYEKALTEAISVNPSDMKYKILSPMFKNILSQKDDPSIKFFANLFMMREALIESVQKAIPSTPSHMDKELLIQYVKIFAKTTADMITNVSESCNQSWNAKFILSKHHIRIMNNIAFETNDIKPEVFKNYQALVKIINDMNPPLENVYSQLLKMLKTVWRAHQLDTYDLSKNPNQPSGPLSLLNNVSFGNEDDERGKRDVSDYSILSTKDTISANPAAKSSNDRASMNEKDKKMYMDAWKAKLQQMLRQSSENKQDGKV